MSASSGPLALVPPSLVLAPLSSVQAPARLMLLLLEPGVHPPVIACFVYYVTSLSRIASIVCPPRLPLWDPGHCLETLRAVSPTLVLALPFGSMSQDSFW